MAKTPAPAPIDFESDWRTYDRWRQEDKMWYENQKSLYGDTGRVTSSSRAKSAASGASSSSYSSGVGSRQALAGIPDYEAEYKSRVDKLENSALADLLFGEGSPKFKEMMYKPIKTNSAMKGQDYSDPSVAQKLVGQGGPTKDLNDPTVWYSAADPNAGWNTPDLEGMRGRQISMYEKAYGSSSVENPYAVDPAITASEAATGRAARSASGGNSRRGGATGDEENVWI